MNNQLSDLFVSYKPVTNYPYIEQFDQTNYIDSQNDPFIDTLQLPITKQNKSNYITI